MNIFKRKPRLVGIKIADNIPENKQVMLEIEVRRFFGNLKTEAKYDVSLGWVTFLGYPQKGLCTQIEEKLKGEHTKLLSTLIEQHISTNWRISSTEQNIYQLNVKHNGRATELTPILLEELESLKRNKDLIDTRYFEVVGDINNKFKNF